jgi:hypothetical protein
MEMLTVAIVLVTASMATTSLAGKAMRCKKLWMHEEATGC